MWMSVHEKKTHRKAIQTEDCAINRAVGCSFSMSESLLLLNAPKAITTNALDVKHNISSP